MSNKKAMSDFAAEYEARRYEVKVTATDYGYWSRYELRVVRGMLSRGSWYGPNAERLARKGKKIADRLNRRLDERDALQRELDRKAAGQ